ncbi:MAG: D-alanyl-D-alanine carboxypeptidase [Eubacterium sp.]|nr:D-alanyl-D-alanine carboxypeptidase [Eubacterium sp.]
MKKVFISILTICIMLTPLSAFAAEPIKGTNSDGVQYEYLIDEQQELSSSPEIGCKAAFVANPETGKIFYQKNADKKMFPASTTKILTALVVLENCDLDETAVVTQKALDLVPEGYSNANMRAGEEFTVYTLLQALLIPSANEAAIALAEHVSGSIEKFADLCNKRAKELGCKNLHFVNPNGVHSNKHYCTAHDLYLIAAACQSFDAFREIVSTPSFTVPATDIYKFEDRTFNNTNELILNYSPNYYPECTGIKTGHTEEAGECLVSSASKDNIDLICVVLGGKILGNVNERFTDTKKLFDFVFDNYEYKQVLKKGEVMQTLNVDRADKDTASLDIITKNDIYTIVPKGADSDAVEKNTRLKTGIQAPLREGARLGVALVTVDGITYYADLVASHSVKMQSFTLYIIIVAAAVILLIAIIIIIAKSKKKKA